MRGDGLHRLQRAGQKQALMGQRLGVGFAHFPRVGVEAVMPQKIAETAHAQLRLRHFPALKGFPAGLVEAMVDLRRGLVHDAKLLDDRADGVFLRAAEVEKRIVGVDEYGVVKHGVLLCISARRVRPPDLVFAPTLAGWGVRS